MAVSPNPVGPRPVTTMSPQPEIAEPFAIVVYVGPKEMSAFPPVPKAGSRVPSASAVAGHVCPAGLALVW
jgi:hypothetical protein